MFFVENNMRSIFCMFFDILKHEIIAKFFDSTVCLKITLIQKFDGNMETQIGSALVQFIHGANL